MKEKKFVVWDKHRKLYRGTNSWVSKIEYANTYTSNDAELMKEKFNSDGDDCIILEFVEPEKKKIDEDIEVEFAG